MKIMTRLTSIGAVALVSAMAALCFSTATHAFQAGVGPADSGKPPNIKQARPVSDAQLLANPLVTPAKPGLTARKPMPKTGVFKPAKTMDMLIIKFGDPVLGADAERNGRLTLKQPFAGKFQTEIDELAERFNVTFRQAVPTAQAKLELLYERAEENSHRMQPNLKSYMYVEGPAENLHAVAIALNKMPIVEVVQWYEDMRPSAADDTPTGSCCLLDLSCVVQSEADCTTAGGTYNGDDTDCEPNPCNSGACCIPNETGFICSSISEDACNVAGGYFQGDSVACVNGMGDDICDDLTPECGESTAGSCYWRDGENGTPFCSNQLCCDIICDQDPFCCDELEGTFDEFCAAMANQLCATPPADRCDTPLNGSCIDTNPLGGCDNSACCNIVCTLDPTCCTGEWDAICIELARENCADAGVGATVDYTSLQGYRSQASYLAELNEIPEELQGLLPVTDGAQLLSGFAGQGWNLYDSNDPHAGLYGIGQELIDVYNVDQYGSGVLTRGATIKIAIIEWGYWGPEPFTDANGNKTFDAGETFVDVNGNGSYDTQHEDLDVTLEEGQTLFLNPSIAANDHGTATLGIVAGLENGFGVTGLAPDAEAYFFPLTSVEEGPRTLAAWTSALSVLGPGDVISASYGPGPLTGNLNNDASMWPIIRLASDLGITVCIAAGNDCFNLDDAPDLGDSGAMVVGASSPGAPHYRLGFSNFCTAPDLERSNIVHVNAWGTAVVTTGYGTLALPDGDRWRSYTNSFGGTSAAAPQIAGIVACLQGLAKQFYGIPLSPEQIRGTLGAPGIPPVAPFPRLFGGFDDSTGLCSLDLDSSIGPNMIGPYPDVAGTFGSASSTLLNQDFAGFGDSPLIEDVVILSGDHIFGSDFSVFGSDDNYLVVNSERVTRNGPAIPADLPASVPPGAVGTARYMIGGQTVDVLVVGRSPVANVSDITIIAEYQPPTGIISIAVIEAFDWNSATWQFISVDVHTTNGEVTTATNIPNAYRFVRIIDRTILYRLYITSFGFSSASIGLNGSGRKNPFVERLDWFGLQIQEGFAAPLPGPNL